MAAVLRREAFTRTEHLNKSGPWVRPNLAEGLAATLGLAVTAGVASHGWV